MLINMDELRDSLNELEKLRKQAITDRERIVHLAREITGLRQRIQQLMGG